MDLDLQKFDIYVKQVGYAQYSLIDTVGAYEPDEAINKYAAELSSSPTARDTLTLHVIVKADNGKLYTYTLKRPAKPPAFVATKDVLKSSH